MVFRSSLPTGPSIITSGSTRGRTSFPTKCPHGRVNRGLDERIIGRIPTIRAPVDEVSLAAIRQPPRFADAASFPIRCGIAQIGPRGFGEFLEPGDHVEVLIGHAR